MTATDNGYEDGSTSDLYNVLCRICDSVLECWRPRSRAVYDRDSETRWVVTCLIFLLKVSGIFGAT